MNIDYPEQSDQIEKMMDKYGSHLYRLCAIYLKDADIAKDAVQDTFIKAFRHLNKFDRRSSEKTWLTAIAINVCKDYLRTSWLRKKPLGLKDDFPHKEAAFSFPDDTVLDTIMGLSQKYREVVLLRYYEEMTVKQIADLLNTTESKVRYRIKQANAILRDALKEWYYDEGN